MLIVLNVILGMIPAPSDRAAGNATITAIDNASSISAENSTASTTGSGQTAAWSPYLAVVNLVWFLFCTPTLFAIYCGLRTSVVRQLLFQEVTVLRSALTVPFSAHKLLSAINLADRSSARLPDHAFQHVGVLLCIIGMRNPAGVLASHQKS